MRAGQKKNIFYLCLIYAMQMKLGKEGKWKETIFSVFRELEVKKKLKKIDFFVFVKLSRDEEDFSN
jgi:hypothetical protein